MSKKILLHIGMLIIILDSTLEIASGNGDFADFIGLAIAILIEIVDIVSAVMKNRK